MKSLTWKAQRFLVSENGTTTVEYAVMLGMITVVCLAAMGWLGSSIGISFNTIANTLASTGNS